MAETYTEWLEAHADRSLARQRSQVETAKLLATFTAAIAATVVATALQVGPPTNLDKVATFLLAAAVAAAIIVILCDRMVEADHAKIVDLGKMRGWSDDRLLKELKTLNVAAAYTNESTVKIVKHALTVEVILCLAAGTAGAISLLS